MNNDDLSFLDDIDNENKKSNNVVKWTFRLFAIYFIYYWITTGIVTAINVVIPITFKLILVYYAFKTVYHIIKSILLIVFDLLRYGKISDNTDAYIGYNLFWWIPEGGVGNHSDNKSGTSFYVGYYDGKPIPFLKWW